MRRLMRWWMRRIDTRRSSTREGQKYREQDEERDVERGAMTSELEESLAGGRLGGGGGVCLRCMVEMDRGCSCSNMK